MKRAAQIVSGLALIALLVSAFLFFAGRVDLPAVQRWMLISTVVWFLSVPFWMKTKGT
jgi:hypothetical protein